MAPSPAARLLLLLGCQVLHLGLVSVWCWWLVHSARGWQGVVGCHWLAAYAAQAGFAVDSFPDAGFGFALLSHLIFDCTSPAARTHYQPPPPPPGPCHRQRQDTVNDDKLKDNKQASQNIVFSLLTLRVGVSCALEPEAHDAFRHRFQLGHSPCLTRGLGDTHRGRCSLTGNGQALSPPCHARRERWLEVLAKVLALASVGERCVSTGAESLPKDYRRLQDDVEDGTRVKGLRWRRQQSWVETDRGDKVAGPARGSDEGQNTKRDGRGEGVYGWG
ncbi:hypothetical protein EDB83DRAFT_2319195 [Lactarius deliciosus]|nr:hypothetical protein EDB83DRAFT_2319195 [Lactarius deliciosus]